MGVTVLCVNPPNRIGKPRSLAAPMSIDRRLPVLLPAPSRASSAQLSRSLSLLALAQVPQHTRFPSCRVLGELVLCLLLPHGHTTLSPRLLLHLLEVPD